MLIGDRGMAVMVWQEDFLTRFFSGGVLGWSSCQRHRGTEAHYL